MADWKEKYFASLESLEDKEKEWQETDQLLRRCLSRITLAADGQDKRLDDLLERLRNSVRREKNMTRIQNTVDAIVEMATGIAENKTHQPGVQEVLLDILQKIDFPKSFAADVKRLRKKIEYASAGRDPAELTDNLIDLLADMLAAEELATGNGSEKKGLLSNLFGARRNSATEEIVPEVMAARITAAGAATLNEVDEALVLVRDVLSDFLRQLQMPGSQADAVARIRQRVQGINARGELKQLMHDLALVVKPAAESRTEQDKAGIAAGSLPVKTVHGFEINEILIQLLERMGLPEELNERVEALKSKWLPGVPEDQIVDALEAIAELVIEIRSRIEREKNEIQLFLKHVTDRLLELDKHIQEDTTLRESIFTENQIFGEAVDGQVQQIQIEVHDATDLADLKLSIYEKLETITRHVEGFRGKEEERKEAMAARIEVLTRKVSDLEGESCQLREKVVEEQQQALRDALTRIPNRLAWDERIALEYGRWRRYNTPLVLVVWDVDDFKKINDTYGHKAGDKVLVTIATVLHDQIRETDFLARFGGEEFVLLLTETTLEAAVAVVEKLRKAIEDCHFHHGDKEVKITVSGGFTAFEGEDTIDTAFERADQFMYKAKRDGKNHCISDLNKQ
ncbi:diguanylate cyclase [Sulfuriflexus sp.]|uniref:sensor domain-containing diguanylate cyclase n=1 Tax=Sulfuriflexus sp. TaxID=2015443 RepID=UPI0028CDE847|nr:diguanylate cyclase [Sulfuriflexus sp.]MDT8404813.1 diguanylate cyclase [Sulfuriflexus sp.]